MRRALPLLALVLPGTAWASDFGCAAEWLDLAVVLGAPFLTVQLVPLVAMRVLEGALVRGTQAVAAAALVGVLATTCDKGHDPDAIAIGVLAGCVAVVTATRSARLWLDRQKGPPRATARVAWVAAVSGRGTAIAVELGEGVVHVGDRIVAPEGLPGVPLELIGLGAADQLTPPQSRTVLLVRGPPHGPPAEALIAALPEGTVIDLVGEGRTPPSPRS